MVNAVSLGGQTVVMLVWFSVQFAVSEHSDDEVSSPPHRHYLHLVSFRAWDCLRNAGKELSIIINYDRIMISRDQQMYNFMFFGTSQFLLLVYGLKSLSQYTTRLFKFCFLLFKATWIVSNHYPLIKSESWVQSGQRFSKLSEREEDLHWRKL